MSNRLRLSGALIALVIASLLVATAFVLLKPGKQASEAKVQAVSAAKPAATTQATFVGSSACAGCHEKETELWKQSHHFHAMETVSDTSVLGDFSNTTFNYNGHTSHFVKQDSKFVVSTQGDDGKDANFTVSYTLGYKPLQQYLVTFADGRIQTLPFAWDAREKKDGGQRWFHLYPNDKISADNPLFWTHPLQNWNHMCGDCHTTNYAKNFSDKTNTFDSHWTELANGCESCHGAGSAHVALMQQAKANPSSPLPLDLQISRNNTPTSQMDVCGNCHGRRLRLKEDPSHEQMMQTWQPELLHEGLYHSDGQMNDEVFNTGSFLQSKMYANGVTCTNCHNPHTGKTVLEGNALCTQCHVKETYDTPKHSFHAENSEGAQCVGCHMPVHTYMVIDKRHDHRFSIPRPDLSVSLGVPNPCVSCHRDEHHEKNKSDAWAAKAIADHLRSIGKAETPPEHFATTFWQLRHEQKAAADSFDKLLADAKVNAIVKATALSESAGALNEHTFAQVVEPLKSTDALLRLGAVEALANVPPEQRTSLLLPLMDDTSRAVRFAVAPLVAAVDAASLTAAQQQQRSALIEEYKQSLLADSDRGNALVSLASLSVEQGDMQGAQQYFDKALQRDGKSLAALLNYADYRRSQHEDSEAEKLLTQALAIYPDSADAHYAFGLLRVRQKNTADAVSELKKAAQLAPDNSQYAYVLGIGLYSAGDAAPALDWLMKSLARFPANENIHAALLAYCGEQQYNAPLHHAYCENPP